MNTAKRGYRWGAYKEEADACPEKDKHTKAPEGYLAWHEWAEEISKTHDQRQCPTCHLWVIWEPRKEKPLMETKMCACGHPLIVHGIGGHTAPDRVCHGWKGQSTPADWHLCDCRAFEPWGGSIDARTGEPVKAIELRTST